jgi:hypothetical protein
MEKPTEMKDWMQKQQELTHLMHRLEWMTNAVRDIPSPKQVGQSNYVHQLMFGPKWKHPIALLPEHTDSCPNKN